MVPLCTFYFDYVFIGNTSMFVGDPWISWATLTHPQKLFANVWVDKKCLMIQTSSTWHYFPMNQSYLVIHQNWTQRIKKIPRVILGLPCLTVNMIYMNLEVPFHWELEHRLLTIISHLILLLASCLMFWRLCPAVSFSVAGFSRYSSVFSLYPVVTGFSRYSSVFSLILWVHSDWLFCYVVISPERAYPGPFLVVSCWGGGVVSPPPPVLFGHRS